MQKLLCARRTLPLRSFGHRRYYTSVCWHLVSIYSHALQLDDAVVWRHAANSRIHVCVKCQPQNETAMHTNVANASHRSTADLAWSWPGLGLVLAWSWPGLDRFGLSFSLLQQIWPSLDWNKLCTVGHNIQECLFFFREMWLFFLWKATISTFTIFVECHVLSRKLGVPPWVDFIKFGKLF